MRRTGFVALLAGALALASTIASGAATAAAPSADAEYIVMLSPGTNATSVAAQHADAHGAVVREEWDQLDALIAIARGEAAEVIATKIADEPDVEHVRYPGRLDHPDAGEVVDALRSMLRRGEGGRGQHRRRSPAVLTRCGGATGRPRPARDRPRGTPRSAARRGSPFGPTSARACGAT